MPINLESLSKDPAVEREEIEEFADRRVQARGARTYQETYSRAETLKQSQKTIADIQALLHRPPKNPAKDKGGSVPLPKQKEFAAETRMSVIRDRAIRDVMRGRPPAYR